MKSYTILRNLYGKDTKNESSANLTYGDEIMNDFIRRLLTLADFPFLHRLRTITTVAPTATFTAVAGTDVCTAGDNILTETGTRVRFTTTDTLPAGLAVSTDYYLIFQSTTTFKVASSLANALAGTAIDITDTGTGTHTVSVKDRMQALPYDMELVENVSIDIGGTIYTPNPSPNHKHWDELNRNENTSDTPLWWFVHNNKFGLWPRPSTDGNLIYLNGKIRVPDLNIADYTTGNIDIATNGSTKITGAGSPAWTTPMAGRWLRITHSNTAASSGDHEWYEIAAVESTTILYLVRPYGGRSLTTGAAASYIISQMPALPEAFHLLPELYAAYRYWLKENDERKDGFKSDLNEGLAQFFRQFALNDLSMILESGYESYPANPNLTIRL